MQKIKALVMGYKPSNETKDVGQIPIGLARGGYEVLLITLDKKLLDGYHSPLPIIKVKSKFEVLNFIKANDIVFIHSVSSINSLILKGIKDKRAKILLKLDSDGRMGKWHQPKARFYVLRSFRKAWWKVPFRLLIYTTPLGVLYEREEIKKLNLADVIVVESPTAMRNVYHFLSLHNRLDLTSKIYMIPNPVTGEFSSEPGFEKENIVISIGRWDDRIQKNPKVLIKTLALFLNAKPDWKALVIGPGESTLKRHTKNLSPKIKQKINILGPVPHQKIADYLRKTKILFIPSRFESFGIVAAEALCSGCSIVNTPIEPLEFMSAGGFSGTTSLGFDSASLFSALLLESELWEKESRDSKEIASYWRKKLELKNIIAQFENLINKLKQISGDIP